MITSGGQQLPIRLRGYVIIISKFRFQIEKKTNIFVLFESIMSVYNTALSVGNIIGIVIGILSAIATIICLIMMIYYCCKNKNRNNVWAERPPPYYNQNRPYGQTMNTHYYQEPTTMTVDRFDEKF